MIFEQFSCISKTKFQIHLCMSNSQQSQIFIKNKCIVYHHYLRISNQNLFILAKFPNSIYSKTKPYMKKNLILFLFFYFYFLFFLHRIILCLSVLQNDLCNRRNRINEVIIKLISKSYIVSYVYSPYMNVYEHFVLIIYIFIEKSNSKI